MQSEMEERHSALDQFAAMSRSREASDYHPVATAPGAQEVFAPPRGAVKVEVKRDLPGFIEEVKQYAAFSGQEWFYRFPVKNRKTGTTDYIEGPSIKLANDLVRLYKNCDIDTRVIDLGDNWLIYCRFIDIENGVTMTRPFMQRKNASRLGGDDDGRRLEIALAIGVSKAIRNSVVNALQSFAEMAFEEAKNSLVEKIGKDLVKWRERTAEKIGAQVALVRVEAVIGKKAGEWLAPDVARVIAMAKSVQDGFSSLDETFPPLDRSADTTQATTSALDDVARLPVTGGPDRSAEGVESPLDISTPKAAVGDSGGAGIAPPAPPAEIFDALRDRCATAASAAALDELWDHMDIDARLGHDKLLLDRAKKIVGARRKELQG